MSKANSGYVVGWFVLSLIIAGLAEAFGRSGFLWWLFGLVTGPVALFFLVLFGPAITH